MASWAACAAGPGGRPVAGIEGLLRHGAERDALDDRGRTPLAWLAQAAKSVDEHAVRTHWRPARHDAESSESANGR